MSRPDHSLAEKRKLLAKQVQEKVDVDSSLYPLSHGQSALWFLYELAPESVAYNIMHAVRLRFRVNKSALLRSFQTLIDRHSSLRTVYSLSNGKPVQRIQKHQQVPFEATDAADWSWESLNERLLSEADRPFDLERGPILRVHLFTRSATDHILLLVVHHIAVDVWSLDILMNELRVWYGAELIGKEPPLPPANPQYTDYVRWEAEMLASEEGERLWNYWSQELSGELPGLTLPTVGSRPPVQTYRGSSHTFRLGQKVVSQLRSLTKAEGGTLFMILLAAFQILLHRYTGQQDILVGSPVAVRNRVELERVVGYLINPVVLRAHLSGHLTFKKFFGQVRQTVLAALEHHAYPLSLLIDRLQPARDASRSPLFQVMFIWDKPRQPMEQARTQVSQTQPMSATYENQFQSDFFASAQRGAALDLILTVFEVGESLSASLQYNVDLFDAPTIARMASHFRTLLESIGANPDRRICELPLLTGAERYQLLREWNDTQKDYPNDDCIHQLFEAQAKVSPDSVALSFDWEPLTYRQLNERANQLANFLRKLGVGPEVLAGICLDRSTNMVIGLLGILKAGGAYVPLDPAFPKERLAFMLRSAQVPVLLTQHTHLVDLPEYKGQVLCLDTDWPLIARESHANPATELVPDNLAYVIYTSGSTGGPKGVQISHRAVVNFLSSMTAQPGITRQDILFAVTSISFDIAALELLLPLTVGAQVVIAGGDVVFDGVKLVESLGTSEASIMQATPATWRLLLKARWPGKKNLKILSGGEALSRKLANELLERGSSLWNLYGPTETTIWSTVLQVVEGAVSIGHPIANSQVYLLDPNLQPVPVGVTGELYIGGAGLARGYLNNAELTAMRFVPDPFGQERGGRLYKTGDLARYSPDGNIEFLNRIDSQVKVRGFRIELEEVESALNQHPGVQEAVVVRWEDSGEGRLVAYVVARDSTPSVRAQPDQIANEQKVATLPNRIGTRHSQHTDIMKEKADKNFCKARPVSTEPQLSVSDLRNFLENKLPAYMVPSTFVMQEALPLTPNGKVDRKALPAPTMTRPTLAGEFVAPRTPLEETLAAIWVEVLSVERVGIHDNFFELGGASIQALEIVAKTEEKGLHFAPELLFEYQTIAELADVVTAAGTAESD